MLYVVMLLLGVFAGAISVYVILENRRRRLRELEHKLRRQAREIDETLPRIRERERELKEFEAQVISYKELKDENAILKHDLQNIDVNLRKIQLDRDVQRENQEQLDQRSWAAVS